MINIFVLLTGPLIDLIKLFVLYRRDDGFPLAFPQSIKILTHQTQRLMSSEFLCFLLLDFCFYLSFILGGLSSLDSLRFFIRRR